MLVEVGETFAETFAVGLLDVLYSHAAVHLEALRSSHDERHLRLQTALAALDVVELLCSEVGTEASLRDDVVAEGHSHLRSEDGVAAVSDIGERTAVYERCGVLSSLHEVWRKCVAQQNGDGASHAEILHGERLALNGVTQKNVLDASAQVVLVLSEAEYSHNLRRRSDVETRFAYNAVRLAAHASHDVAQSAVVHVEHAVPEHFAQSESVIAVLVHIVVEQRRDSVVR